VLLVTSGAVGIGRQLLSKQARLSLSVRDIVSGSGCVLRRGNKGLSVRSDGSSTF